jgi:hypothetical protein
MDNYYTKGEVDGFVGDLTKLKTTNKDNLVNVINTDLIPR